MTDLSIVTGPQPEEQVLFAANELKRFVSQLFGATAVISPEALPAKSVVFLDPSDRDLRTSRHSCCGA